MELINRIHLISLLEFFTLNVQEMSLTCPIEILRMFLTYPVEILRTSLRYPVEILRTSLTYPIEILKTSLIYILSCRNSQNILRMSDRISCGCLKDQYSALIRYSSGRPEYIPGQKLDIHRISVMSVLDVLRISRGCHCAVWDQRDGQ